MGNEIYIYQFRSLGLHSSVGGGAGSSSAAGASGAGSGAGGTAPSSSYQLTWPITSKKSGVVATVPNLASMCFISLSGKISSMVLEASLCMELFLWWPRGRSENCSHASS